MVLSMVAGSAVISAPVAAATNGGAVTVDDGSGGVYTNHHWSTTANSSDDLVAIELDYSGTGTDLSKLSASDVSVTVAGSSVPVDTVSESSSEYVTVILASSQSIATDDAIVVNTTANQVQNPFTSGSYSADLRLRNSSNVFQTDTASFSVSDLQNAAYLNRTDTTYNSSTQTTLDVTYNMTGTGVSASELVVALDNGSGFVASNNSLGTVGQEGTAQLSFSSGTIAGTQSVTYVVFKEGALPNGNATDQSTLTDTDTTTPTISSFSLGENSGDMAISFRSDEKLGDSSGDITVTVGGPNTATYTFDRNDFSESGSGPYTYTLTTTQAFDDGDGTYEAVVDDAKDPAGNNGASNSLTDSYSYSSGGGLPNAPYVNKSDDTHDSSTDTTVSVSYNATGEISPDNVVVEVRDSQGSPINATTPGTSSGTTDITISSGTLSGDSLLTYALVNDSTFTTNATDQSWLNSTGGESLPNALYVNKSDDTHDNTTDTTIRVTYNATGEITAANLDVEIRNSTNALINATSPSTTEGTTDIVIPAGTLSGDEQLSYALYNTNTATINQTDQSWLNVSAGDTTAPSISGVIFSESSGDMVIQFDSDEKLGTNSGDITVQVNGPNGKTYSYDRSQFSESGSYTYSLNPGNPFDDGDGSYNAAVLDAKDSNGNNGGMNGEGSSLDASYMYSSGGGGGSQPNSPYINNTADTYASSTATTLFVNYNATGLITSSDITLRINDSSDTTIASDSSLSNTQGEVSLSFGEGSISGDEQLTFEMVNSSTGTVEANDTSTLEDTVGSGGPFPDAPYINATNQTYKATESTTVAVEYNITTINTDTDALSIDIFDNNGNLIGFNASLENTEGVAQVEIPPGELPGGDQNVTYKLNDFTSVPNVQATDSGFLLDNTPTGTIEGQLTDTDGNALSNTPVIIDGFGVSKQAITDGTGNYSVEVPIGTYSIGVEPDGYAVKYVPGTEVGENETITQNIEVGQGGTLEGTVVNDTNDNPVPGSFIIADGGGDGTYFIQGNSTGQYSKTIPEGNYSLSVFGGPGTTQKQNYQVNITEGQTTNQEIRTITTSLTNTSVSYLSGSGSPDMNNISVSANLNYGMVQVRLQNNSGQQFEGGGGGGGMPEDLEGIGVADDDRFEISFTVEGYDPTTLLWGAKNVNWSTNQIGPNTYNVTVETETVHLEGLNDPSTPIGPLRQRSPDEIAWPTGVKDKADLGWNNTVYFTMFDMSNVPEDEFGNLEGMTVATNAQTFSRPRLVEKELANGETRDQLEVYVGAPGNTTYGADHDGFYEAFIPDDVLNEWNVSDPEAELNALYKGQDRTFTVNETANGAEIELDLNYSDGRVEVTSDPAPQFDVSIDSTNSPVTEGNSLDVTATITNNGGVGGTQTVTLDLDNTQVDSQSVQLPSGQSTTVTFSHTTDSNDVGQPTATVTSENDTASTTVEVNSAPSPDFNVSIDSTNSPVTAGDTLDVTANVTNDGGVSGTQTVTLDLGNTQVDSQSVQLSSGQSTTVTFSHTTDSSDVGQPTAAVSSENDTASTTAEVNSASSPDFAVSIDSTNSPVTAGDTLDVTATITNNGDASGTQTVTFDFGNTQVDSQSVQLSSGQSTTVTFSHTTDSADVGQPTVTVSSENDTESTGVDVNSASSPGNFAVTITSIDSTVTEGEDVTIEYEVENTGGESDTQDIVFSVDGTTIDTDSGLSLDSGQTTSGTFTYTTQSGDTPDIDVAVASDNETASSTVTVEEPGTAVFDITSVSSPDEVTEGDTIDVETTIENTGDAEGTQTAELQVGGTVVDSQSVQLTAGSNTTLFLSYQTTSEDIGDVDLAVSTADASQTVTTSVVGEAAFDISIASDVTDDSVVAGGTADVVVDVENVGTGDGTETVTLSAGGQQVGSQTIDVAAGTTDSVTFTVNTAQGDVGELDVVADGTTDSASTSITVEEQPDEASFDVTITDTNGPVTPGDDVSVTATVENVGERQGTEQVDLVVRGTVRDSQSVTLDGGENTTVTFSYTTDEDDVPSIDAAIETANDTDSTTVDVEQPGTFAVSIDSTNEPVTASDDLNVDIVVENVGTTQTTETVELQFGGEAVDSTEITLDGGESTVASFTVDLSSEDEGENLLEAVSADDSATKRVTVGAAAFFEVELTQLGSTSLSTADSVVANEEVTIQASVQNTGDETATKRVVLTAGGERVTQERIELSPDEDTTITGTFRPGETDIGDLTVRVGSGDTTDTDTLTVDQPAAFDLTADVTRDEQPVVNQSVELAVDVENTGDVSGTERVDLFAGGEKVDEVTVDVGAGDTETVTVEYVPDEDDIGEQDLSIVGSEETVGATIDVQPEPDPGSYEVEVVDTNEPVLDGEDVSVTVGVENVGDLGTTESVETNVTFDPLNITLTNTTTFTLDGGESERFTVTKQIDVGLEEGEQNETIDIAVSGASDTDTTTADVIAPPEEPLFRIDTLDVPSSVDEGDTVTVGVTVTNVGELDGTDTIELTADGEVLDSQEVTLNGGESETLTGTIDSASAGDITINAGTSDQTASTTVDVVDLEPPTFEVVDVSVPDDASSGETVSVTVDVANTGDESGTGTLDVDVGEWSGTDTISLGAGQESSTTVDVEVGQEPRAGTFTRDVDVSTDDDSTSTTTEVDYGTIQSGVDTADPGDDVLIAGGSYRESVTIRTPDIELVSLGSVELDARTSTGIEIRASDVTLSGMTIDDNDAATGIRIAGDDARIDQVEIDGPDIGIEGASGTAAEIRGAVIMDVGLGVLLGGADGTISQTRIEDADTGIELRADSQTVRGTEVEETTRGILLGPDSANTAISNADIFNNGVGVLLRGGTGHVVSASNLEANEVSLRSESASGSSTAVGTASAGLEATDNWWGSEDGPDELDIVDAADGDTITAPEDQQATEPYESAEFVISDVSAPEEGIIGSTLSVDVTIENVGDLSGLDDVELSVDGTTLATDTVELNGSESVTITLENVLERVGDGETELSVVTGDDTETRDLTVSSSTRDLKYYAEEFGDDPNIVDVDGLIASIQDWQDEKISKELFIDVLSAWAAEEEVTA